MGNEDQIEGYEHIWQKIEELEDEREKIRAQQVQLAAQETNAVGEEKQRSSDKIDELTNKYNEAFDQIQHFSDQFREEYVANNGNFEVKHLKREIAELKDSIPEDNNVLSGSSGPLMNVIRERITNINDVKADLYLDKSVDAKIAGVCQKAGKNLDPLDRIQLQRSIAELSGKMATSQLMLATSMLEVDDFKKISNVDTQKEYHFQMPYEVLEALKKVYDNSTQDIEDQYRDSMGRGELKDIQEAAKKFGIDGDDLIGLIQENKNIILKNLFNKLPDMKKYCYEETNEEHPYSQIEEDEFARIKDALDHGSYVGASTGDSADNDESDPAGIGNNHAYAVIGTSIDEKGRKFVIVRDPGGGAGAAYDDDGERVSISEDESYGVNKMELHHFLNRFEGLTING